MAENVTLITPTSLTNQNTALAAIRRNNATITSAFSDTLSRAGHSPNQMASALDMNGYQIVNLPSPIHAQSPVRLMDLSTGTAPSVSIISGNNVYTGNNTFGFTTMSEQLNLLNKSGTPLVIDSTSPSAAGISWTINDLTRWKILGQDGSSETGSNAGSNFALQSFTDAGDFLGQPLSINRSNGSVTLNTTGPASGFAALNVNVNYSGVATPVYALYGFNTYTPTTSDNNNNAGLYGSISVNGFVNYTGSIAGTKGNSYALAILSAAISNPGSNNQVGDTLTIQGGDCTSFLNIRPTFRVTGIGGGGAVTSVAFNSGACMTYPADPVVTTSSNVGATPPTLSLAKQTAYTIAEMVGVGGRARNESGGTVSNSIAILADGEYNSGSGFVTRAIGVLVQPPYQMTGITTSHGVFFPGNFQDGSIAVANGSVLSINVFGDRMIRVYPTGGHNWFCINGEPLTGNCSGMHGGATGNDNLHLTVPTGTSVLVQINGVTKHTLGLGLQVGSPGGGDKGTGTINAIGYYTNGVTGADCSGVNVGTMVVSKGIVTHC